MMDDLHCNINTGLQNYTEYMDCLTLTVMHKTHELLHNMNRSKMPDGATASPAPLNAPHCTATCVSLCVVVCVCVCACVCVCVCVHDRSRRLLLLLLQ